MGLNSSLSSPTSEQVCLKKGQGDNVGIAPGNWLLITDHAFKGFPDLKVPSNLVISNLVPSYSAIVHWIGCINAIKLQIL